MYTGTLPPVSIYETWFENLEVRDTDDELIDFSGLTEITLTLRDIYGKFTELTLTYSGGDISLPPGSYGIVQWTVAKATMGAIEPKTYKVVMVFDYPDGSITLILGTVDIVE